MLYGADVSIQGYDIEFSYLQLRDNMKMELQLDYVGLEWFSGSLILAGIIIQFQVQLKCYKLMEYLGGNLDV